MIILAVNHSEGAFLVDFYIEKTILVRVLLIEFFDAVVGPSDLLAYLHEKVLVLPDRYYLFPQVLCESQYCELQFDYHAECHLGYVVKLGPLGSNWLSPSITMKP